MADQPKCACGAPLVCCVMCLLKKQAGALAKAYGPMVLGLVMPKLEKFLADLPEAEGGLKK